MIYIAVALINQEINELILPLTTSIIQGSLVQVVWLVRPHTQVLEDLGHPDGSVVDFDQSRRKHRRLLEVSLVKERANIIVVDSMLHENLINIAIFHVIEEFLDVSLHLLVDSDRLYVLLWGHQRAVRGPCTCLLRRLDCA